MLKAFKNLNLKTKILALTLFLVLILAIVSVVMIISVQSFKSMTGDIDNASKRIYLATKMESTLKAIQVQSLSMFVNFDEPETIKKLIAENDEYQAQFDSLLDEYSSVVYDREDSEILELLNEAYDGLNPLVNSLEVTAISRNEKSFKEFADQAAEYHLKGDDAAAQLISFNSDKISEIRSEVGRNSTFIIILLVGVTIIVLIASLVLSSKTANMISKPVNKLLGAANSIASGNVSISLDIDSEDEIGVLAKAFKRIVESFKEQTEILSHMAEGDLTARIGIRSENDVVNREINRISENNSRLVSKIMTSSQQVLSGSQQIAQDAQNLASGSVKQAGAIEELSKSIDKILAQSEINSSIAAQAYDNVKKESALMFDSMNAMDEMTKAMDEINRSSKDISTVIKVIEDIAFQTNILALNASVEAARAGSYGSGFAVVAGEVRNLASRSASAARETAELIENSISRISEGNAIAGLASESLTTANKLLDSNAELMKSIDDSSKKQNSSIVETKEFLDRISAVIQTNTSSSEESAASAQEIAAQTENLNGIIASFKIALPDETPDIADREGAEDHFQAFLTEDNQTDVYID